MQTDWNDIFFFTVLVEQETLTAAAAALDVRHTTVARRVARLEQSLGLRLFDRLGKRYRLTADGMRVYQRAAWRTIFVSLTASRASPRNAARLWFPRRRSSPAIW